MAPCVVGSTPCQSFPVSMNSTSYNPRISSSKPNLRSGNDSMEDSKSKVGVKLPQKLIDVPRLITLVRQNEPLYNPRHCQFRDKPYTTSLWQSIARELGTNAAKAKLKWQNLRSNYRREKRKLRDPLLPRAHIWPYFRHLSFLGRFSKFRDDFSTEDESCDASDGTPQRHENFMTAEIFWPNSEDPTYEYLSESGAQSGDDSPSCSADESIMKGSARNALQIGSSSLADDPNMLFFKGLLPHVKQLRPKDKVAFKREVVQLLVRKLKSSR